mgnify:CR=1 FL=1
MYVALKIGYVTSPVLLPINQGVTQQLTQSVTTMAHVCMYIIHESYLGQIYLNPYYSIEAI